MNDWVCGPYQDAQNLKILAVLACFRPAFNYLDWVRRLPKARLALESVPRSVLALTIVGKSRLIACCTCVKLPMCGPVERSGPWSGLR